MPAKIELPLVYGEPKADRIGTGNANQSGNIPLRFDAA